MIAAAAYLLQRSAANRVRHMARKVRSPRYLIALLIGIGYLGLIFFGQRQQTAGPAVMPVIQVTGTTLVLFLVAKWWLFGTDRTALAFSPAEIQFFFPAPVSRKELLGFKLLRAQLPILVNVAIWIVILHRGRDSPLPAIVYAISLWSIFMVIMLHRLGVALTRDAVTDHGTAGVRRHWATLSIGLLLALIVLYAGAAVLELRAADPEGNLLTHLTQVLNRDPLRTLLAPFHLPFSLIDSPDLTVWAGRFLLLLGLIGLHLVWVFRADRAFEEAAIAASVKRAELLDRWRRQGVGGAPVEGAHRRSIPLRPRGHPIGAIVWKNLTRLLRTSSSFALILMLTLVVGVTIFALTRGGEYPEVMDMVSSLSIAWILVLSLFGPQWIRIDLRSDMQHLDQLRTWPLAGGAIVAGEVLSSGIALLVMQLMLGVLGVAALSQHNVSGLPLNQVLVLTPAVLLLLTGVNLLSLGFQNAAAILYPAWVRTELRPGGIEAMGQHLLTAGASLLLLLIALVGPGGLAAVTGYLLWPRIGTWNLLPAMGLGLVAILLEVALLLDWLGTRLEQFDPTRER